MFITYDISIQPSGAVNVSPSLDRFSQPPPQFPRQTSYSRYLPVSNTTNSPVTYGQNRWGQQEPASPTKHVQFTINTSNAHLYYKFITDPQTGIPHQERIVNGDLQRVLVGKSLQLLVQKVILSQHKFSMKAVKNKVVLLSL